MLRNPEAHETSGFTASERPISSKIDKYHLTVFLEDSTMYSDKRFTHREQPLKQRACV